MHDCFQVYGLTCGHAANPLAIEPEAVSFGWKARHTLPGRLQKSYRIQVFHNSGKTALYGIPALFYPGPVTGSRTKGLSFWRAEIINGP